MIIYKENVHIGREKLEELYSSVGWRAYTNNLALLDKAIQHSLDVITAWEHEKMVGLIRVIGDGYTVIYIQDILVHPDYQNRQIATQLMCTILEKYKTVRQKILLTEDAPNVRHFYEKFGFFSCDQGSLVAFYQEG